MPPNVRMRLYSTCRQNRSRVMTADRLPVLFCNREGTEVAAAPRGLARIM